METYITICALRQLQLSDHTRYIQLVGLVYPKISLHFVWEQHQVHKPLIQEGAGGGVLLKELVLVTLTLKDISFSDGLYRILVAIEIK